MMTIIVFLLMILIAIIFTALAISNLLRNEKNEIKKFILFLCGIVNCSLLCYAITAYFYIKDLQKEIKQPIQYELVKEPVYRRVK